MIGIIRSTGLLLWTGLLFPMLLMAQQEMESWQHKGAGTDFQNGVRSEEFYTRATSTSGRTIVVAVLDSGVDTEHQDLKGNIWVNPGEIPGNNIDDDGNGYVDDVHGWNFIGGPDGRSVIKESYEVTRLYGQEKAKWEGQNVSNLKGKKKKAYEAFRVKKEVVETKIENAKIQLAQIQEMESIVSSALKAAKKELGDSPLDLDRLEASKNEEVKIAARIIRNVEEQGLEVGSIDWLLEVATEQFIEQRKHHEDQLDYGYNPYYDSRTIVGDRYDDFSNRYYGNNDVAGDFAFHGTHVAGIIGAIRDNGIGMDGIADKVAIMCVRLVPDGDERDKDVANGIIYAVDNGAQVINMSFGKGYSPEKHLVDKAMKYAARKDVLLVVGAGNEGADLEKDPKFPNDTYEKKPLLCSGKAPNMLSVGALSPESGEGSVAEFSNYGRTEVDVFAPGVYIYSTTPDGMYDYASGTSMAAPVVSGVAALIRSRYPDLSARQVKDIIIKSTRNLPGKVIQPGTFELVSAAELGVAGIVDVVSAMKLAASVKGKARMSKRVKAASYTPAAEKA